VGEKHATGGGSQRGLQQPAEKLQKRKSIKGKKSPGSEDTKERTLSTTTPGANDRKEGQRGEEQERGFRVERKEGKKGRG